MGEMMEQIAVFHDEEMSRWVDWFTRPVRADLDGRDRPGHRRIVILMYMPIFELAGSLQ